MPPFSRRTELALGKNALTRALEARHARGEAVLSLVESNPTEVSLSLSAEALQQALAHPGNARYSPEPFGLESARRAVAADFAARGFSVSPAHIMLTASTSEAYAFLFKLLCDPGDAVLVPAPSYPLFDVLAKLERVRLVPYRLSYDGEWHLCASALAGARDARAKAVIVVHPNNPTGHFVKRDELRALRELGLPIVSDEVFADYALREDPRRAQSALEAAEEVLVFRMAGLSKSVALPQLKLAWTAIAGPPALRDEACERLEHIADSFLSAATPVQQALPRLLAHAPRITAGIRARCAHNLEVLVRTLTRSAASVLRVEGGWYALVRLPEVQDEEQWALALLERHGLLVQPGYFYDTGPGAHVVLSLITPEDAFAEGVRRLCLGVSAAC